jgi:DHA2 family multidrug resistance protein
LARLARPASSDIYGSLSTPTTDPSLLDQVISQQSVLLATNDIFWLSGCFFVALILMVWLAKSPKHGVSSANSGAH